MDVPEEVEPEVMAAVVAAFGQHEVMAPPVEPEPVDEPEGGEQPSAGSSSETSTASTPRKYVARKANRQQPAPTTESP